MGSAARWFFSALSTFIVYATWAAFQGNHFEYGPYLSPFYSPLLFGDSHHAWFGPKPGWWPGALPFSAALLILWAPGGFRFTCYYYRGAYYKAFWADPPSCTVGEPRKTYLGERSFPLVLQNIHRYFLYLGLIFIVHPDRRRDQVVLVHRRDGRRHFGIGVGSLVLTANTILLARLHVQLPLAAPPGRRRPRRDLDVAGLRWRCYSCVSGLNRRHQLFAWLSLFSVGFADLYVRLCSMGIWTDFRIL